MARGVEPAASPTAAARGRSGVKDKVAAVSDDRHFRTDHLVGDLKQRSVRGGAVTLASQGGKFVLQMGSTMILARLLTPEDFGLITMVSAIMGFVFILRDAGLSTATVQRDEVTHGQVSTLFWINVALSVVATLVLVALAPAIAWFYAEPALTWVTVALAGTFVFGGLSVQHHALLKRQMRFKDLAWIQVLAMLAGVLVGIAMAYAGFAYWSLVGMGAANALANLTGMWVACRWRPSLPRRGTGVRPMLGFGGHLLGFNVTNYVTRNMDNVIIGKVLGPDTLGLYGKAYGLLLMPIRQINGPVGSVMLPTLSRLQNDPARFRRFYLAALALLAFVTVPIVAFAFADTRNFILVFLGGQWVEAVPIFQWLAPAGALGAINVAPGWLCMALGRSKRQFLWALISAPVMVTAFAVSVQFGVVAVAASFSIGWSALFAVFIVMACHDSPVRAADVGRVLMPPLLAALAGVAGVYAVADLTEGLAAPVALVAHLPCFGVCYLAVWLVLADRAPLVEVANLLLKRRRGQER